MKGFFALLLKTRAPLIRALTSRRTQGYALKPDADSNARMLSDLLSDGLNRAFSDPELGRLLAR
ncbi:hypothetical protein HSBAA_42600 [Vreelandella sulfidaeris]|uniref:Uncharacterized protein n=1 Tax=Vreelandella sulfidaeris TaxID=115553 RepID=A0A455UJ29_9GAMM|nr:hypothetical protein HSBAA_42600 [Halomonas sulfidaeris]